MIDEHRRAFLDQVPEQIRSLVDAGALFFCNTSGGKDSQLMTWFLQALVPPDQLVLVKADLGEVDWAGVADHIEQTAGVKPHIVKAKSTLFEIADRRRKWPSPKQRWCTSDLKRTPIASFIRRVMKLHGVKLAVDCIGLRAAESSARSRKVPLQLDERLSKAGRQVTTWLPIHNYPTQSVFDILAAAGLPLHHAYSHNTRLSCVLCIMASGADIVSGAAARPDLVAAYSEREKSYGHTLFTLKGKPIALPDYIAHHQTRGA